ncbi:MAG: hypothetical protein KY445_07810 [Armatimonadetes bacterium]|nr:hypothetical protein [Armatimonadota bacterium]
MTPTVENYQPGSLGKFYYNAETAAYPAGSAVPAPAVPVSVVWGGWADVPDENVDDGSREVYSLGSDDPQLVIPGGRIHTLGVTTRLANKPLLQKCIKGSGGFRDLADLCLVTGTSTAGGSRALRFAKCNTLTIAFQEGSAQDITAAMEFWGLAEEGGSDLTPTAADILSPGTPLTWHNVTEVNIGPANVRDVISGITLTVNNNLERKGFRPDYGTASPWSRTTYALLPRQKSYRAELSFHTPDVARYVLGLVASGTATGAFSIVVTDSGSSIQGASARTFTFSAAAGRIATRTRRGGDPAQELTGTVTLILTGVSIT